MPGIDRPLQDVIGTREPFLRSILDGPKQKSELREAADASRSTVDRAVRDLLECDLIERTDKGYEATLAGRTALSALDRYHRRLGEIRAGIEVFRHVPADVPIADRFLDGAEVIHASPEVPDGVMQRLFDSVEPAAAIRCIAPAVLSGHIRQFHEVATAGGATLEMVLDHPVVEQLLGASETSGPFLTALGDELVELRRADVPFSYGLWITDDEAGIVLYSDTGVRGVIVNDTEEALAWARSQYERIAHSADPIEPPSV
ncbi:transcriptional regulator FilR1 domain-containing protein [Halobellus sp. GM3]|uniref:transcriptional regulator FilR1 domain-containing protein n=1 Tax=Halobellus sp. GM3 TaxID=3458410 RepID=UPI00403DBDF7